MACSGIFDGLALYFVKTIATKFDGNSNALFKIVPVKLTKEEVLCKINWLYEVTSI